MRPDSSINYNRAEMSLSTCALTGQPLKRPMVSTKTGHLYEQEIIEKHLSSFPYCPLTNQPMQLSDLVSIQPTQTYLRPDQAATTYLHQLHHEYDLLVVDAFNIRQALKQTEEELTSSLYQNQAANRVIAKLLRDKEEAEAQAAKLDARIDQLKSLG